MKSLNRLKLVIELFSILLLAAFALSIFSSESYADSEIAKEDELLFSIRIPFEVGAKVTVLGPDGKEREEGEVTALPTTTRWPSYTASAWGTHGEICASAVNAIHMLVSVEKEKGRTLSIIPKETVAPAAGPGASVIISSKAGTGIFGAWAPPVGSKISVIRAGATEEPLALSYENLPKQGDTLLIKVYKETLPYFVELENRPGGRITAWYGDKGPSIIGRVIKPISGTGRFEGTLFQKNSTLRANHSGVIDFSTSPYGQVGGFQIIPWDHALTSKEMQGVWDMTQWLIAGPADGRSPMSGQFPLFSEALVPGPADGEALWDLWATYGRKSLILARLNGGKWQKLPEVSGRADNALKEVTHLRIYYPNTDEPQKQ